MRLAWVPVLAACAGHHASTPAVTTQEAGISIAIYDGGGTSYGVVDDRRWVTIAGGGLELDHIDPGAALASLVIEPLGGEPITIAQCARARLPETPSKPTTVIYPGVRSSRRPMPKPVVKTRPAVTVDRFDTTVRCAATGGTGRHLVRILYVSTTLTYRAQHEFLVTTADHATVTSRFAIETPAWHDHAELALFDGIPGGERLPHEVVRGGVTLDGSIAILAVPAREVPARLRRVFDGAVATPELPGSDAAWYGDSVKTVTVWLELPGLRLAPGSVRAHVEVPGEAVRDIDVSEPPRQQASSDAPLRLALWADDTLTGTRQRFTDQADTQLAERVMQSVANLGDMPREVWIEEHVRPARRRKIERAWPSKPMSGDDVVRSKVIVKPHAIERVGYTLEYEF